MAKGKINVDYILQPWFYKHITQTGYFVCRWQTVQHLMLIMLNAQLEKVTAAVEVYESILGICWYSSAYLCLTTKLVPTSPQEQSTKQWLTVDIVYLRKDDITNGTEEWVFLRQVHTLENYFLMRMSTLMLGTRENRKDQKKKKPYSSDRTSWKFLSSYFWSQKIMEMQCSKCCIFWLDTVFHIPSVDIP